MPAKHARLLILGSGPAGYTRGSIRRARQPEAVLITGLAQGGQLMTTTDVDNWPADADGVHGPRADGALPEARRALRDRDHLRPHPHRVDLSQRPFRLTGDNGEYTCDALIIATGASAHYLGLPSEEAYMGRGVSACATCDGFFYKGQDVVVVGGGNTAVEEALYLSNIARNVTLVHRRDKLRAEAILVDRLHRENARPAATSACCGTTSLDEVLGDDSGVTGVRVRDVHSGRDAGPRRARRVHRDRPHAEHADLRRPARHGERLHPRAGRLGRQRDGDQRAGRVRRRRRRRPRLPPGRHVAPAPAAWRRSTPKCSSKPPARRAERREPR